MFLGAGLPEEIKIILLGLFSNEQISNEPIDYIIYSSASALVLHLWKTLHTSMIL